MIYLINNHLVKFISFVSFLLFLIIAIFFSSVTRTIEEDQKIKLGFNPVEYVDGIWDTKILTTIDTKGNNVQEVIKFIFENKELAEERFGNRSGTGNYSYMVKGEGMVTSVNKKSRVGTIEIKLDSDISTKILIAIGPVVKKDSIRDAVGFIQFNDFENQIEFADVSRIIKVNVLNKIIGPIDFDKLLNKKIKFQGAFTHDRDDKFTITPTLIEEM